MTQPVQGLKPRTPGTARLNQQVADAKEGKLSVDQVKADKTLVDAKELAGKTVQDQNKLAQNRLDILKSGTPQGDHLGFQAPSEVAAAALDPAGTALKRGSRGPEVAAAQKFLTGPDGQPIKMDGRFGKETQEATVKFQRAWGLKDDGVAGKQTISTMKAIEATDRMKAAAQDTSPEGQQKFDAAQKELAQLKEALPAETQKLIQQRAEEAVKLREAAPKPELKPAEKPPLTAPEAKVVEEKATKTEVKAKEAEQLLKEANDPKASGTKPKPEEVKPPVDPKKVDHTVKPEAQPQPEVTQAVTKLNEGAAELKEAKDLVENRQPGPHQAEAEVKVEKAEEKLAEVASAGTRKEGVDAQGAAAQARQAAEAAKAQVEAAEKAKAEGAPPGKVADLEAKAKVAVEQAKAKIAEADTQMANAKALAASAATPEEAQKYTGKTMDNAQADLTAAKQTLNGLKQPGAAQTPAGQQQVQAAVEQAKVEAAKDNGLFSDADKQARVGASLGAAIEALPGGALPEGTVNKALEQVKGQVHNEDQVAAGIVNRLGPEGVARLHPKDQQQLKDMIGYSFGDANQSKALATLEAAKPQAGAAEALKAQNTAALEQGQAARAAATEAKKAFEAWQQNPTPATQKAADAALAKAKEATAKQAETVKAMEAKLQDPKLSEADRKYLDNSLAAAKSDLSQTQKQLNLTGTTQGATAETKAALDKAVAEAKGLNDENNAKWFTNDEEKLNAAGAKVAEGILSQPGKLPDGTVKGLMDQLGTMGKPDEVAAGLVNRLGEEGIGKLSKADRQELMQHLKAGEGYVYNSTANNDAQALLNKSFQGPLGDRLKSPEPAPTYDSAMEFGMGLSS